MKIACVIHRYGADIAGGSESHCRAIAQRLASHHDVTVLTTTAKDHITWASEYPAGVSADGAVRVHRFAVARQRSMHRYLDVTERACGGKRSEAVETEWFQENGPDAPALLKYLDDHGRDYDRILFWSFRYATTFFGVPRVADRAILLPTAEEDPVIRFRSLKTFFTKPSGLMFLTPEEQELVAGTTGGELPRSTVIGTGLDPIDSASTSRASLDWLPGVNKPFVLYLGRVDPNKGCGTLLRYFLHKDFLRARPAVTLVLAGPINMPVPEHPQIRALGQVSAAGRDALLAETSALVMPSPYESLSLVLLEAWNHAKPALVNGRCAVLKGQALRSGGALYYRNVGEFAAGLRYLLTNEREAKAMGQQALAYVDREYRWPKVIQKIESALGSRP